MLSAYFNLIYCWTYNNCQNKSLVKANKTTLYLREQCCWKTLAALCIAGTNFKPTFPKIPNKLESSLANTSSSKLPAIGCQNHLCPLVYAAWFWFASYEVQKDFECLPITCTHTKPITSTHSPSHGHFWAKTEQPHIPHWSRWCPFRHPILEDTEPLLIHLLSISFGPLPSAAPQPHFLLNLLCTNISSFCHHP